MTRTLKSLGLCLFAVLALGALAAQSALAVEFHSSVEHTALKGSQVGANGFEFGEGNVVECSGASLAGTSAAETTSEIELAPTYTGCKAFGFASAHVNFTACFFQDTLEKFVETPGGSVHVQGVVHLKCPNAGEKPHVTPTFFGFSVCSITIKPGTFSVDFTVKGSPGNRSIRRVNTGRILEYEETSGECGVGSGSNGGMLGETEVTGSSTEGSQTDLWVE